MPRPVAVPSCPANPFTNKRSIVPIRLEEVSATNNHAERLLRHAVCMRKVPFGTKSPEGSRVIERALSTVTTLRFQNRPVRALLTQAVETGLHGQSTPSLLPPLAPGLHAAV